MCGVLLKGNFSCIYNRVRRTTPMSPRLLVISGIRLNVHIECCEFLEREVEAMAIPGPKDYKYRKYVALVDRALVSFDSVKEWADVIAFLGKLLKSLQAYPQYSVIPHKLTVTKRLAQCLNPALPTGVHQKALDVYGYIFETIGPTQLAVDLPLYSYGLFPFLQYAAMSVKPQLLSLFEKYYFPLRSKLKPCTKSFMIALLPGLEEEGSEFFARVLSMIDLLNQIIDQDHFFECLWLCLITAPQMRIAELNFLSKRMPKFSSQQEMVAAIGKNTQLMVRAFAAALESKTILVQRAVLELLVVNFPIKNGLIDRDDMPILMRAAVCVVLRRDMSLNRRLYAWLLGSSERSEHSSIFFEKYSKAAVVTALKSMLYAPSDDLADAQQPYRVLVSLLDKNEIGGPVVEDLFLDAIIALKKNLEDGKEWGPELLQTVNMFVEMLDPYLVWMKVYEYVDKSMERLDGHAQTLDLVEFILQRFTTNDEELEQMHLPMFFIGLLARVEQLSRNNPSTRFLPYFVPILRVCLEVISKIPARVFLTSAAIEDTVGTDDVPHDLDITQAKSAKKDRRPIDNDQIDVSANEKRNEKGEIETAPSVDNKTENGPGSAMPLPDSQGINLGIVTLNPGDDVLSYVNDFYLPNSRHTAASRSSFSSSHDDSLGIADTDRDKTLHPNDDLQSPSGYESPVSRAERQFAGLRGFALVTEAMKLLQGILVQLVRKFLDEGQEATRHDTNEVGNDVLDMRGSDRYYVAALDRACELLRALATYDSLNRTGVTRESILAIGRLRVGNAKEENLEAFMNEMMKAQAGRHAETFLDGEWLRALVTSCRKTECFEVLNAALSTVIDLIQEKKIVSPYALNTHETVNDILDRLWNFLSPSQPSRHLRTVQLLWMLAGVTSNHLVETALCRMLIETNNERRLSSYERFGVFWRLSDEVQTSSTTFTRSMLLMLDTLRDDNPSNRRAGETWIRINLKSYVRIFDPILLILLDGSIQRKPAPSFSSIAQSAAFSITTITADFLSSIFLYERHFDQAQVDYVFDTMLTICRYGGQPLLKRMRATAVTPEVEHEWRRENEPIPGEGVPTYLAIFVKIASRFILTEIPEHHSNACRTLNDNIHCRATDLLHYIISGTEATDENLVVSVQDMAIRKLLYCISVRRLDLQTRLLHLLHATMARTGSRKSSGSASSSPVRGGGSGTSSPRTQPIASEPPSFHPLMDDPSSHQQASGLEIKSRAKNNHARRNNTSSSVTSLIRTVESSPLFVRAILDALSASTNRAILQHWMDFILTSLPLLRNAFKRVLLPAIMCICEQLNTSKIALQASFASPGLGRFQVGSGMSGQESSDLSIVDKEKGILSTDKVTQELTSLPSMRQAMNFPQDHSDTPSTDVNIIIYLNGLERMLSFCLADGRLLEEGEGQPGGDKLHSSDSTGGLKLWAEYVSNVFAGDSYVDAATPEQKAKDALLSRLGTVLRILLDIWIVLKVQPASTGNDRLSESSHGQMAASFAYIAERVNYRLQHLLDRLYKHYPSELIEALVEVWFMENPTSLDIEDEDVKPVYDNAIIDLLGFIPSCTPADVFNTLVESIRVRSSGLGTPSRQKKTAPRSTKLTDIALLNFMHIYCTALDKPELMTEMWPSCITFVKDYLSQASNFKYTFPYLLRLLTLLSNRLSSSASQQDDKRLQRDALDTYQRVLDYSILIAGKSFDQGIWRRSNRDVEEVAQSPLFFDSPGDPKTQKEPSLARSSSMLDVALPIPEGNKKSGFKTKEDVTILQVMKHLSKETLPAIRRVLVDPDRILAVVTNLVYYVVGPTLKNRQSKLYQANLEVLCQTARIPFVYKTWRKEAWDAFLDAKFFSMGFTASKSWRFIVQTMLLSEKERFAEILGRISTSPSTALFTNRESEMQGRAYLLRRITYILLCGSVDQYLQQLPSVQEKLVELMKLDVDVINAEIFLCLRVLLCRISNQHLSNFWPVLLTELIKFFQICLIENEPRREIANVVLAGCKFLDLLFTLETDEFQVHQWIFITETITSYAALNEMEGAMMDRVGQKLASTARSAQGSARENSTPSETIPSINPLPVASANSDVIEPSPPPLKRPLLTMSSITGIRDLYFFLTHVSHHVYQSTFELAKPDMPFIVELVERDMLDEEDGDITVGA